MSVDSISATAAAATDTSRVDPPSRIDPSRLKIATSIKQAAGTTGVSFEYMLTTAKMESNFNPKATAGTSSARGLYQFIDQTWLGTVKEAGGQLGYGQYADAISRTSSGDYVVRDAGMRHSIMKLRDDPVASSAMAAILTQSNSFQLTGKIGRRPTDAELYMAHFLGVGGAATLINSAVDNPQASAARMFPSAAAANRSIFYDKQGSARSVSEVYAVINGRYASAAGSSATQTALAMYGTPAASAVVGARGASATGAAQAVPALDSASFLSQLPDVRKAAPVTVAAATDGAGMQKPIDPMFRSLFKIG